MGYAGVDRTRLGHYRARISLRNRQRHVGSCATAEEAARLYDAASLLLGRAARNFPGERPGPSPMARAAKRVARWHDRWGEASP
jgi:hypothetical protein